MSAAGATRGSAVHVVGDSPLLCSLARRVLERHFDLMIGESADHATIVAIHTPIERLRDVIPAGSVGVLITSRALGHDELLHAVRSGVVAVADEASPLMVLEPRIVTAAADQRPTLSTTEVDALCAALRNESSGAPKPVSLSSREVDILRSMEAGESVKQTARALGIAIKTVENTQRLLFRKLDVRNRSQAIARIHELNLLLAVQGQR